MCLSIKRDNKELYSNFNKKNVIDNRKFWKGNVFKQIC